MKMDNKKKETRKEGSKKFDLFLRRKNSSTFQTTKKLRCKLDQKVP